MANPVTKFGCRKPSTRQGRGGYVKYIATRPRAERFGSHGLFTDSGVQVDLQKVSDDLNQHKGNVWTIIISLRREDAVRLGFDHGSRWRDMLRTQTQALSENLKIPMEHLKWFAAFHDESYHPHIHLIAYSDLENEGYLSKQGVMKLRSAFAWNEGQKGLWVSFCRNEKTGGRYRGRPCLGQPHCGTL